MIAEKIELEPIESSNLEALGYNVKKQIAALKFKNGHIFHYVGMTPEQFLEWYGAESKGGWYARNVRGKLHGEKMTGHCPKCGDLGWVGETCGDCGCAPYAPDEFKQKGATNGEAGNLRRERSDGADTGDPHAGGA